MGVDVLAGHRAVHRDDGEFRGEQRRNGWAGRIGVHRVDDDGLRALGLRVLRLILLGGGIVLCIGDLQVDVELLGFGLRAITQIHKEGVVERGNQQRDLVVAAGRGTGAAASAGPDHQRSRADEGKCGTDAFLH